MKALSFFVVMAIFSSAAFGQDEVPEALQKAFAGKFPNAKSVWWEDPVEGVYEVEFKQDGKRMTADFKANGTWMKTGFKINEDDLSAAVKKTIAKEFGDFEIDQAKSVKTSQWASAFEVLLDQDDLTLRVTFSPEGKVLEKKVMEE